MWQKPICSLIISEGNSKKKENKTKKAKYSNIKYVQVLFQWQTQL